MPAEAQSCVGFASSLAALLLFLPGAKSSGVAVKSYLPNYRRPRGPSQFSAASTALAVNHHTGGRRMLPAQNLIFRKQTVIKTSDIFQKSRRYLGASFTDNPFCRTMLRGAAIIGNLSASNITIRKAEYRQATGRANQSALCRCLPLRCPRRGIR